MAYNPLNRVAATINLQSNVDLEVYTVHSSLNCQISIVIPLKSSFRFASSMVGKKVHIFPAKASYYGRKKVKIPTKNNSKT